MLSSSPGARPLRIVLLLLLAVPPALTAGPIHVTGRVLAEGTRGLSGARVELFPAYEGYAEAVRRIAAGSGPVPLATALAGADGSFRVDAPGPGCFRLTVRMEGLLTMEYPLAPLVEDAEVPPAALPPASPLVVLTRGADGRPSPGIAVRIEQEMPDLPSWLADMARWRVADRRGISGPDGRLVLPWAPGNRSRLTALSPRFLGQGVSLSGREQATVLVLSPRPAARIEARDAAGRIVPGALVRWRGEPVARTGPHGRVEVAAPEGETLDVENSAGERARFAPRPAAGIVPVALGVRRIAGKLLDEAGGRPVVGGLVWIGRPPVLPAALSGAGGAFQIDLPRGGEDWIESAAAGFLPGSRRFVRKEEGGPILLKLSPAAMVSGIVTDPAGRPVAAAQVELADPSGRGFREPVHTGSDGRFRFPGLQPGKSYGLTASHEDFAPATATAPTAPAGRPTPAVRIVLGRGATAAGRLVGEDGRPVAGAELALVRPEERFAGEVSHTRSDGEGRFELRRLTPGTFDLIAAHPGHARLHAQGIEIPAGAPRVDLGTLTMPSGTAVEGRVVDAQGSPIPGAQVMALPEAEEDRLDSHPLGREDGFTPPLARTGTDGSFRVEGLRRGSRYLLAANREGYAAASAPGVQAPTEEPVRIVMEVARTLAGQVVDPEGAPVAGARLSWVEEVHIGNSASGTSRDLGITDADGRFRVTDLPPGAAADLLVKADGYLGRRVAGVQIPRERDPDELRIVLARGARLDVRVLDAAGEPLPDAWVNVSSKARASEPRIVSLDFGNSSQPTDAGGRCQVTVEPGVYQVRALADNRTVSREIAVGPEGAALELRLPSGAEVSGQVIGEDGKGVAGAQVRLTSSARSSQEVLTGTGGAFLFSGVTDGSYQLVAHREEGGQSSDPIEIAVAGKPVQGLEIRLSHEGTRLTGRLLRFPPETVSLVQVAAFGEEGILKGEVDPSGTYLVQGLTPGAWTVRASLPSGRETHATVRVRPGDSEVVQDLDLSPGVTISGHVLLDGAPLAGAVVQSFGLDLENREDRTAYDGSFALHGVSYGPATLLVGAPGGIGASRKLMIRDSQDVTVEIATGRLRGRVFSAEGEPVEDATVEVQGWEEDLREPFAMVSAQSGSGGLFELPRLGAGLYRVLARKPGFAPTEVRIEVRPGQDNTVEVRLAPAGTP